MIYVYLFVHLSILYFSFHSKWSIENIIINFREYKQQQKQ